MALKIWNKSLVARCYHFMKRLEISIVYCKRAAHWATMYHLWKCCIFFSLLARKCWFSSTQFENSFNVYIFLIYSYFIHIEIAFQVAQIEWCKRSIVVYIIPTKPWMVWLKTKIAIFVIRTGVHFHGFEESPWNHKKTPLCFSLSLISTSTKIRSITKFVHCYSLLIIHFGYVDTRYLYKCVYCALCILLYGCLV